jgi:hypothetical protein
VVVIIIIIIIILIKCVCSCAMMGCWLWGIKEVTSGKTGRRHSSRIYGQGMMMMMMMMMMMTMKIMMTMTLRAACERRRVAEAGLFA